MPFMPHQNADANPFCHILWPFLSNLDGLLLYTHMRRSRYDISSSHPWSTTSFILVTCYFLVLSFFIFSPLIIKPCLPAERLTHAPLTKVFCCTSFLCFQLNTPPFSVCNCPPAYHASLSVVACISGFALGGITVFVLKRCARGCQSRCSAQTSLRSCEQGPLEKETKQNYSSGTGQWGNNPSSRAFTRFLFLFEPWRIPGTVEHMLTRLANSIFLQHHTWDTWATIAVSDRHRK